MIDQQVRIEELFNRLFSPDYEDIDTIPLINNWREENRRRRAEEASIIAELSQNSVYRFARVERSQKYIQEINKYMPVEKLEIVEVKQSDIDQWCKQNRVSKDELLEAIQNKRENTVSKTGQVFQAYPKLYSAYSEAENKQAIDALRAELEADEQYFTRIRASMQGSKK